MATTTNYGWTTPDDTDLVKDGAAAIRTLGSSIDTSFVADEGDLLVGGTSDIFEALPIGAAGTVLTSDGDTAEWVAPAAAASGLTLVSSATMTAATNLSVDNCFTSTYDNYLILADFPTATGSDGYLTFRLRASGSDTTTNYGEQRFSVNNTSSSIGRATTWDPAYGYTLGQGTAFNMQVFGPNLARKTMMLVHSGYGLNEEMFLKYGQQSASTQFDGFSIVSVPTLTGEVRVYGYQNS